MIAFEIGRLLRNPFPWCAAVLALAWLTVQTWTLTPDWSLVTIGSATAGLVVAATVMIVANAVTTRERGGGMPESLAALPAGAAVRTRAALVGAALIGTLAAALMVAAHLLSLLPGTPAGSFDLFEALTAVAVVPLAAAGGVALGRWLPSPIACPAAILLVLLGMSFLDQKRYGSPLAWLMPATGAHIVPVDLVSRPSGWHLLYLLALTALFAALALLRHGVSRYRLGAAALALSVAAATAVMSVPAPYSAQLFAPYAAGRTHQCHVIEGVTYCAFPAYTSWIPLWSAAVGPVAAATPPAARARLPRIRQQVSPPNVGSSIEAAPSTGWPAVTGPELSWGRNGAEEESRTRLAGMVVAAALGYPPSSLPFDEAPEFKQRFIEAVAARPGARGVCDARGQARTVVALWLAGQAGAPREGLLGGALYGPADLGYARRLLALPGSRERIWTHWAALTAPETTTEQALARLGLAAEFPAQPKGANACG